MADTVKGWLRTRQRAGGMTDSEIVFLLIGLFTVDLSRNTRQGLPRRRLLLARPSKTALTSLRRYPVNVSQSAFIGVPTDFAITGHS